MLVVLMEHNFLIPIYNFFANLLDNMALIFGPSFEALCLTLLFSKLVIDALCNKVCCFESAPMRFNKCQLIPNNFLYLLINNLFLVLPSTSRFTKSLFG